jgi:glucosylglycerate synthase
MNLIEDNPQGITNADIVVGIPSFNEAPLISFPTQQADKGLCKYFSDRTGVIINCDNHSPDGTREAFMQTASETPKIYLSTEDGVRGKGNNLLNLFKKSVELKAKAVVVVDADLKSITPMWIRSLAEPLFEEYQFVSPLYVRHKYDGTITNNIAYPLTRALYGRRVRQPIGGDYGISGELLETYLGSQVWDDNVANFGIDIWMTTLAVRSGAPVIQSFMGRPKIHKPKDPADELLGLFHNVVGTVFELMCRFDSFWKEVKWSRPTAVFGFGLADLELPPVVNVDIRKFWQSFMSGVSGHWDLYARLLASQNLNKLEEVAGLPEEGFEFPTGLWAKVLYDFAVAYRDRATGRDELIDALIPLYQGKTHSFVLETEAMNTQQVEEFVEDQCLQFEKSKQYLMERWFAG